MSENYSSLPNFIQKNFPFIERLQPYFKYYTTLDAAIIAGFIGAMTQGLLLLIPFVRKMLVKGEICSSSNFVANVLILMVPTFIVSGAFGFIMKGSKQYPKLEEYYYDVMSDTYLGIKMNKELVGAMHDGVSGLIVQITLILIICSLNLNKK
tara:strand:- start:538 stop:993 length:456 start_codon:yes stop_codon:yes gene_type:complete